MHNPYRQGSHRKEGRRHLDDFVMAVSVMPKRYSAPLHALALQNVRETSMCVRTSKRASPSACDNVIPRGVCRLYRLECSWIRDNSFHERM